MIYEIFIWRKYSRIALGNALILERGRLIKNYGVCMNRQQLPTYDVN